MKSKNTRFGWLTRNYQLVVRSEDDLAEQSAFRFSHVKLIFLGTALLISLTACSLALTTTVLARWLNPAYIAQENQKKIVQLSEEVEALEQQVVQQKNFITLLQHVIEGKEPPSQGMPAGARH